jgi:hypothetical protein
MRDMCSVQGRLQCLLSGSLESMRLHVAEDLEGRLRCGLSADLQTYALCYALYNALYNALYHALHHNYMPALQSWQNNFVGAGGKSSSIDRCPGLP